MENNNKKFRLQGKVDYHREFGNVLPNKIIIICRWRVIRLNIAILVI